LAALLIPKIYFRRKDPLIWYGAALCVYMFVMSGSIYNAIRGTPFWHQTADGKVVSYIYPSAREQFIVEGYIMASLLTGLGLLVVALNTVPFMFKNPWTQRSFAMGFIILLVYGFNLLRAIMKKKYGHYPL